MTKKQGLVILFVFLFVQALVFGKGNAEPFKKIDTERFTFATLKHAQFYMDSALTLTRIVKSEKTDVKGEGTVSVVNGELIETIKIPEKTGGEIVSLKRGVIGVCFSSNDDRVLYFKGNLVGSGYSLIANGSKVKYGPHEYKVNKKPELLFLLDEKFKREKSKEIETGRKVE